jgi:vitamin B12/bleomycin/antimicrobial peptide transport system ATP-binding/permease protein
MSRWKFEGLRRLFSKSAAPSAPENSSLGNSKLQGTTTSLRSAWQLVKPYYTKSDEKWKARALLASAIGLTLGQVYIDVKLSKWGNEFYNTVSELAQSEDMKVREKKAEDTHKLLLEFSMLAGLFIGAVGAKYKLTEKLKLDWRQWMTKEYGSAWLNDGTYYKIQMKGLSDNPDQRITDDVTEFTSSTLGLGLGALRATTSLPSFSYILWNMSGSANILGVAVPGYLMFGALGYAAIGTAIGHWRGKPLVKLNQEQQRLDADLRYALVNVRNNAESIALSGGEEVEREIIQTKLDKVVENKLKIINKEKEMIIVNNFYNQAAIIAPYIITLPRLVSKGVNMGDFFQCAGAFRQVQGDLSWFFDSYTELARYKSVTNRLTTFNGAIATVNRPAPVMTPAGA